MHVTIYDPSNVDIYSYMTGEQPWSTNTSEVCACDNAHSIIPSLPSSSALQTINPTLVDSKSPSILPHSEPSSQGYAIVAPVTHLSDKREAHQVGSTSLRNPASRCFSLCSNSTAIPGLPG